MAKYTAQEIISLIDEEDVKFIRLQFVDFFGELKNIAITAGQIGKALAGKCRVDGFHIRGMNSLGYNTFYLQPDFDTFAILPWRPQHGKVARFLCRLNDENGNPIPEGSRSILVDVMRRAAGEGYSFDLKPNCEFFLFLNDENGRPTTLTGERAGYLDIAPLDKGENARRDVILTLEEMGFEIESSNHETAPGQHAVVFRQSEGIRVADQIETFRATIRTVAERHGLHATFMPKPRTDLMGSAMAFTISMQKDGKDLFSGGGSRWYSDEALSFVTGIMDHQNGIAAFSNPIINSYKRLKARFFAPTELFWSTTDYYAPLRIVKNDNGGVSVEWKLPDGAANPYLTIAMAIAAGVDGIRRGAKPVPEDEKIGSLPATLRESVSAFEEDEFLRSVCGERYADMYVREKMTEWERYSKEVTDWEIREYLQEI
jgi:glutamine synthetase